VKWFVLRGFKLDDKDTTGFLGINKKFTKGSKEPVYEIVHDKDDALKFSSENINNIDGFGTPKQWLEFFKGEDELSEWKFHLMKVAAPKVNKHKRL